MNPDRQSRTSFSYRNLFFQAIEIQEIRWTDMEIGTEFEVEIIQPLLAKCCPYSKDGGYVKFLAYATADCAEPKINRGTYMWLQLPLRTWTNALYKIPLSVKNSWHEFDGCNLWIAALKKRKGYVELKNVEKRATTEEQKEKSAYYYEK